MMDAHKDKSLLLYFAQKLLAKFPISAGQAATILEVVDNAVLLDDDQQSDGVVRVWNNPNAQSANIYTKEKVDTLLAASPSAGGSILRLKGFWRVSGGKETMPNVSSASEGDLYIRFTDNVADRICEVRNGYLTSPISLQPNAIYIGFGKAFIADDTNATLPVQI